MIFRHGVLSVLLFVMALAACAEARAQDPRLAARLEPEALTRVTALTDSARTEGLPLEPLVQRALEGAAKGANGARIVTAVHGLLQRLRQARSALGSDSEDAELVAGASALYVGADPTTLGELRDSRGDVSVTVPLVVLADLVQRGVPNDTVSAIVLRLTQAGVTDANLEELRRLVEQDIRAGATPGVAATTRAQGLLTNRRPPP
ncbi:MAG: hypothetical protein GWN99_11330 [Gemmatimonadetes bacterium]|uniref:Uncharacterized protein n=1 Tax=Candidatus Kutchimonas denitrificans TaxID=3056748 RepID=A0AAE4Z5C3_9BACT|nr:hypothetical protein [Gemmatimonadota bacterium]NIR74075.1 hypothetical protein [Candidatus Kutchimonas denitrificans]NIS01637.1 hypothetical protein [Gemmatimonadota bacterium]NIT67375.1 hypothetical protein [Gemmatimonadota bacterium]NIU52738.1 hypothetical protein [Gemmatimonadota bacterium]